MLGPNVFEASTASLSLSPSLSPVTVTAVWNYGRSDWEEMVYTRIQIRKDGFLENPQHLLSLAKHVKLLELPCHAVHSARFQDSCNIHRVSSREATSFLHVFLVLRYFEKCWMLRIECWSLRDVTCRFFFWKKFLVFLIQCTTPLRYNTLKKAQREKKNLKTS